MNYILWQTFTNIQIFYWSDGKESDFATFFLKVFEKSKVNYANLKLWAQSLVLWLSEMLWNSDEP